MADCAEFEISTMVVHLPDEDNPHNALGLVRIKRIIEKAEQLRVIVALENYNCYFWVQHLRPTLIVEGEKR